MTEAVVSMLHDIYHSVRTLECLLDVDSVLCAGLKVGDAAFRLAESHGALRGDLNQRLAAASPQHLVELTILLLSSTSILLPITTCPNQPSSISCTVQAHTNGKLSGSMGLA